MNDDPDKKQDPATDPPDDDASHKATISALSNLVNEAYRRGFLRGWDQCRTSVQAAYQTLMAVSPTPDTLTWEHFIAAAPPPTQATGTAKGTSTAIAVGTSTIARGEIPNTVQAMIKERPGLTGVEIVAFARERNMPIHERSVRTALRRLRMKGAIYRDSNGKWFPSATAAGSTGT
jgi:hypothetical protein